MYLDIALQPKQELLGQYLSDSGPTSPTILGYGGSLGGGKSGAARRVMLARRFQYPNTRGIILRRVYRDLKENHIDLLWREFPDLQQYWRASDKELRLPNGSTVGFMSAETESDVERQFKGPEFFDIFIDQAEQFNQKELQTIASRNRWPGYAIGVCKTAMFFNPGGPGLEYLRRIFHLRQYEATETPSDYAFIQAYGWDNYQWFADLMTENAFYDLTNDERFQLFITQTQYGRKLWGYPPSLRSGMLMGSFDSFVGQYFAGVWDSDKCVLGKSLADSIIKPWWTRWMAQDWGFGDHDYHVWLASGKLSPTEWMRLFGGHTDYPMDVVIAYRENLVSDRAEMDLANDIVRMTPLEERPLIQRFFCSSDGLGQKAKQAGSHSVGEAFSMVMSRNRMPTPEPPEQDRISGWRFMFNCLRQANLRGMSFDEERSKQGPALFISADCPQAIGCIPLAIRAADDPDDVERVAGAIWEDVTDGIRYGLKSMLDPKSKAPLKVRAQEVYDAHDDPTSRALALRQLHQRERESNRIVRGRRGR